VGLAALTRDLARARRGPQRVVVAFVDVDGLKAVNDEHGHAAGDRLLRAVVAALEKIVRPYDVVIRYGGDEFICVLCDEVPSNIEDRFEKVIAEFAQEHSTRLSVGFAEAEPDELAEEIIARADAAMMAGRQGRRHR
jgi:diguanylate cyclase (GGDEF)-like protein